MKAPLYRSGMLILLVFVSTAYGADKNIETRILQLEQDNKTLKKELQQVKAELETPQSAQRQAQSGNRNIGDKTPVASYGGQYRINSYSADNDVGGDRQTASRVRIRQDIDIKFDEQLKTHLQLEMGNTASNITTSSSNIKVRHGVIDYTFKNGINAQAGIVPLSDYFGDSQFSSAWYYNPVALSAIIPASNGQLRAFAGNLSEGDELIASDDFVHYQLDYAITSSNNQQLNFALTYADIGNNATPALSYAYYNLAAGLIMPMSNGLKLDAFIMASDTDKGLLATSSDASGLAFKLAVTGAAGKGDFGLMLTHASGEDDGSGFLPIMAMARANGYWGYTGILTIQGSTDTGFDGDSVNISNNGFGLTTLQAKYVLPVSQKLKTYAAAGWFGNSETPAGRGSNVGIDLMVMGSYQLHKYLALDFGAAFARVEDAVSGYSNGVIGGTGFNQAAGTSRNKTALFTRLQTEY